MPTAQVPLPRPRPFLTACSAPRSRPRTLRLACRTPAAAAGNGRLIVLAAGKAAGSMTEVAERHYLDQMKLAADRLAGIAVTRHGYGRPTRRIEMIEAGHPVPDAAGLAAAERVLELADMATADDLVLVLMSGGASANWIAPADGLSFADKQAVTRALLRSGANIGEINTVRKHLSRIKGGRLALRAHPGARGDARDLRRAGRRSGGDRLRPDRARSYDARRRARDRRALQARPAAAVARALDDPANESPKPGDPAFATTRIQADRAAGRCVPRRRGGGPRGGYECVMLGDRIEGEARDGRGRARLARARAADGRAAAPSSCPAAS